MATTNRIDNFFVMHSARSDRWRDALTAAQQWASGQGSRAAVESSLAELSIVEEFFAYPGLRLLSALRDKIAADAAAALKVVAV